MRSLLLALVFALGLTPTALAQPAGNDTVCIQIYAPVCGSDGTTYSNACFADAAGVTHTPGECLDTTKPSPWLPRLTLPPFLSDLEHYFGTRKTATLTGHVTIGPLAGGATIVAPDPATQIPTPEMCRARAVEVYGSDQTSLLRRIAVRGDCTYQAKLRPATYFVKTFVSEVSSTGTLEKVVLKKGQTTTVDVEFDTGIRF